MDVINYAKIKQLDSQLSDVVKVSTDWINLESLGAVGDGVADCTTFLQYAVDNYDTVFIPNGVFRINSTVTISRNVTIMGGGYKSIIKIKGKITTDTDPTHRLKLFNLRIENHLITGNAIEVIKTNTTTPKNALDINNVCFYSNNNVSSELTSTILYVKGIRECTIANCLFIGDSSAYGTGMYFTGDSAQMTMNITITGCVFYYIGTFIELSTTLANIIYLAGFRIINNIFIGATYGVKATNVDYLQTANSMFDFVSNPIYGDTVNNFIVNNNYLQTVTGKCIYLENNKSSDLKNINISDNYMWSTNTKAVHGIVLYGKTNKITYGIISGNQFTDLNIALLLKNTQNLKVKDHVCYNCGTFIDGNADSTLLDIYNNYAETNVTTMFFNLSASNYKHLNNRRGTTVSSKKGKYTGNGDGSTTTFTIPHSLISAPSSVIITPGSSALSGIGYYVTADATNITVIFSTAPVSGTGNVVINWQAEI